MCRKIVDYRFLYVFILLLVFSCQSDKKARIKGHVEGSNGSTVKLVEVDTDKEIDVDQKKPRLFERFRFKVELDYPKFYEIRIDGSRLTSMLLKPGQDIQIRADLSDMNRSLQIEGSPETRALIDLEQNLKRTGKKIDSLYAFLQNDSIPFESVVEEIERVQKAHRREALGYIIEHPASMVSLAALYQQYDSVTYVFNKIGDLQFFKMVSDSLQNKYPRSRHVQALKANTKNLLENYHNIRMSKIIEGRPTTGRLPDIALPDIQGDTLRLSSLSGKYVLLSFWSANHNESVQYNLELQKVYNTYSRDDFEVYQVSVDTSFTDWQRALRYDEIQWYSVQDNNNYYYSQMYNVQKLPYNLLIDPSQTEVIAKNMGPKKLDSKLKELLN